VLSGWLRLVPAVGGCLCRIRAEVQPRLPLLRPTGTGCSAPASWTPWVARPYLNRHPQPGHTGPGSAFSYHGGPPASLALATPGMRQYGPGQGHTRLRAVRSGERPAVDWVPRRGRAHHRVQALLPRLQGSRSMRLRSAQPHRRPSPGSALAACPARARLQAPSGSTAIREHPRRRDVILLKAAA